jgi:hypothetical protein
VKHILLTVLLFLFTSANAQITTTVQLTCISEDVLFSMAKEYEEVPFAIGITERNEKAAGAMMIFVNPASRTWTLVEEAITTRGERLFCVLAAGSHYDIIFKNKKGI